MTSRRPGQRAGLDTAAVLDAARQLLGDGGIQAVTIRAVARALQVAPNALYSHIASRTALLDQLLDDLLGGVTTPTAKTADPLTGIHQVMSSTYDVLTAAPDLVPLYLSRQGARGPNAIRLGHLTDDLLTRAGIDPDAVPGARRTLIVHTIGAAAFATAPTTHPDAERPVPTGLLREGFHQSLGWLLTGITQTPS